MVNYQLRIRFLKFVGHCGAREILKIFIHIRTRISHLLLDRSDFPLRNILKLLFMISFPIAFKGGGGGGLDPPDF